MQNFDSQKLDDLEIISIGNLHKGSWDKKYWSSSRGKDRYPYPIGYHAVRTHNGFTYKMEICKGLKGPLFQITSSDGESCSGQTPDIAWDSFQKKSTPQGKSGSGKRFSCKIDGVELFGFKNALVQRMLRELISNVNGAAEQKLLSTGFCVVKATVDPATQCQESCKPVDLRTPVIKSQSTRKRSRKTNIATDTISGSELETIILHDVSDNAKLSGTNKEKGKKTNGKKCFISSISATDCQLDENPKLVSTSVEVDNVVKRGSISFVVEESTLESWKFANPLEKVVDLMQEQKHVGSEDSKITSAVNDCSTKVEPATHAEESNSSEITKDYVGDSLGSIESKELMNLDTCAPDSLDLLQECKEVSSCLVRDEQDASGARSLHEDDEAGHTPNENFEKNSDDSIGQDLATSMMTLLLPQALPLLKKTSGRKRAKVQVSESLFTNGDACLNSSATKSLEEKGRMRYNANPLSPAELKVGMVVEGSSKSREGQVCCSSGTVHLDSQSLENVKSVVPDSFEDSNAHEGIHKSSEVCYDKAPMLTSDNLKKDNVIVGESRCISANQQANLKEKFEYVLDSEENSLWDEMCATVDKLMTNNLGPARNNPAPKPTLVTHNATEPIPNESTPNDVMPKLSLCDCTNTNGANDSAKIATLSSVVPSGEEILPPNPAKMIEKMSKRNSTKAVIQYQRRCRSTDTKILKDKNHCDILTDNISTQQISATGVRDVNPIVSASSIHMSGKEGERRDYKSSNISSSNLMPGSCPSGKFRDETLNTIATNQISANPTFSVSPVRTSVKEADNIVTRGSTSIKRASVQNSGSHSAKKFKTPFSESIIFRNTKDGSVPEKETLFPTNIQGGASVESLHRIVSFGGEVKFESKSKSLSTDTGRVITNGTSSKAQAVADRAEDRNIINRGKYQAESTINVTNSSLLLQDREQRLFFEDNRHGNEESFLKSNMHPQHKSVTTSGNHFSHSVGPTECLLPNEYFSLDWKCNKASKDVELLGCYCQPAPILSVAISTQGNDIHICVLCGILEDRLRTIFIYKIPVNDPRKGHPLFLGYTSIMLPISKYNFSGEISFARFPLQFTPDGRWLVLCNNFKAPQCREQNLNCQCSLCTTNCFEESAVKIVHLNHGYVSLMTNLKTEESIRSILVCEPSHLIALDKNGRMQVWAMNSLWSERVEEFILPSLDHMLSCIVEIKKSPKYPYLVIGHNGFGDFGLWDISKRVILSRFSAPTNCIFQFIPVGLFSWKQGSARADLNVEEQIKGILGSTEKQFSEISKDLDYEDIAVWLLVSCVCDSEVSYDHQATTDNMYGDGSWRLALLVDNMVILGNTLDPRASNADSSEGCGIIGTQDGLVYIWELSTGITLADLHHFESGKISCISSDPNSDAFAVAGDENQLLIYRIQRLQKDKQIYEL
ncbi:hypothetical protein ACHQM5_008894 [Ranunculus cassubicifolius]